MLQIAENIRRERISKGLSQQEMADKLGVKRSTYAEWEGKVEPKGSILLRIAEILGMPVTALTENRQSVVNETGIPYNAKDTFQPLSAMETITELRRDKEVLREGIQLSLSALLKNDERMESNLDSIGGKQDALLALMQSTLEQVAGIQAHISGRPLADVVAEVGKSLGVFAPAGGSGKKSVKGTTGRVKS